MMRVIDNVCYAVFVTIMALAAFAFCGFVVWGVLAAFGGWGTVALILIVMFIRGLVVMEKRM